MMTLLSVSTAPSWTSVGTTPRGLSARYCGRMTSPLRRSTATVVHDRPFSASVTRTFWAATEATLS